MSTEGQDYSVLLWEVIDHWKTKPAPSKCDGHESEGAIPSINMMQGWKLQGKWHNEPSLGLINRIKVSGRSGPSCGERRCQLGCGNKSILDW
jgi:hypothetical protein